MELTKFEIRVLLKCYWNKFIKTAAVARRMCEVEGEGIVSELVVQPWFQRFNTGEEITKDLPYSGIHNYGILRIYAEFGRKSANKVFVGCQKNLVQ